MSYLGHVELIISITASQLFRIYICFFYLDVAALAAITD
jgi:hypothetical protein